ncbi:MAG TPA: undecaprenyl-diphosphate phosphatase [Polyangiaceae bacterium]
MSPFADATLLGVVRGLTEFLPVSSSGHLALTTLVFGVEPAGASLHLLLRVGTLLATLVVIWPVAFAAVREGTLGLVRPSRWATTGGGRDAVVVLLASVPTALIGFLMRPAVERFSLSPTVLGVGFLMTTLLLISTKWAKAGEAPTLPAWGALLLGTVQGLSVLPGVSRSGVTIAVAMWLGVRKDRAFELSMLASLPLAASLFWELPEIAADVRGLSTGIVGGAVAFATGLLALIVLKRTVNQGRFAWFALWVGPLALATLAMAKAWPAR